MGRGLSDAVKHLIIINVVFWIGTLTIGTYGELFTNLFAFHFPLSQYFEIWQPITHMFMHGSYVDFGSGPTIFPLHIIFNLFGIWMFGVPVEKTLGLKRFLFLYFSAGFGALLLPLAIDYFNYYSIIQPLLDNGISQSTIVSHINEGTYNRQWLNYVSENDLSQLFSIFRTASLGASGCLMGILVAFGMLFPNSSLMLIFLPIPIKAKYFIPLLIGYEIISGISGGSSIFGFNVGHFAHVGGAVVGFIIMWYWKKNSMNKYRID